MKLEVVILLAEYDLDVCFESHEDRLVLWDQVEAVRVWF